MKLDEFIGKEVQIYPNDTYSKFGIIEEINDKGFIIRITKSQENFKNNYQIGDIYYISHSTGFTFKSR